MNEDLKCMPWSADPDRIPDELRCCDIVEFPKLLGETCNVLEYDGSCLDDCEAGTMCVIDKLDSLEGYCQSFCDSGNAESCPNTEVCKPFFEMFEDTPTVPLCMSKCHPLEQNCEELGRPGWTCLPEGATAPSFLCMPPTQNLPKQEYETCLLANDCQIGLACVPKSEVVGCDSALLNCCTRYCDTSEPDPCTGGNECVNMEAEEPGLENVGICVDPL